MSREQWGHGYYQGRRDAFKPDALKQWVAIYSDEGELEYAGRVVQTFPNDHILLELWDVFDLNSFLSSSFRFSVSASFGFVFTILKENEFMR